MPRTVDSPVYQKAQILDALRDTGALIAEARKARGWSQTDLGTRLGKVDRRHVSALEKGDPKVDVGLVVAALWLLDLPLLATLPQPGHAAPTGYYRVAENRAGARRPPAGAGSGPRTSTMISDRAYLWLFPPGQAEPVVCGVVAWDGAEYVFRYGKSYLARPDAIPLSIPGRPLGELTGEPYVLDLELSGAVRDAAPDAWGGASSSGKSPRPSTPPARPLTASKANSGDRLPARRRRRPHWRPGRHRPAGRLRAPRQADPPAGGRPGSGGTDGTRPGTG
ncbi:helix-turn-helix domain-containing protein [Alcanivorax sp. IO_7]|nr:helix-turn-helix domain-containing protein [Alcanivorax sp. IO_7]